MMTSLIGNWFIAHQQFFSGMALAFVLANPKTCALLLFKLFIKIPGVGSWVAKNPKKAEAWFDDFHQAIDDAVEKYAKEYQEPAVPATVAPGAVPPKP